MYWLFVFYGKSAGTCNNFVYHDIQLWGPLVHIFTSINILNKWDVNLSIAMHYAVLNTSLVASLVNKPGLHNV